MKTFSPAEFSSLTSAQARERIARALAAARLGFEALVKRGGDWNAIEKNWIAPWSEVRLNWNLADYYSSLSGSTGFQMEGVEREIQTVLHQFQASTEIFGILKSADPGSAEQKLVAQEMRRAHLCAGAALSPSARTEMSTTLQRIYSTVEKYERALKSGATDTELEDSLISLLESRRRLAAVLQFPSFQAFVARRSLALTPEQIIPSLARYATAAEIARAPRLPAHRFSLERVLSAVLSICEKIFSVEFAPVRSDVPAGLRLFRVRSREREGYLYLQIQKGKSQAMTVGLAARTLESAPAALVRCAFEGELSFANVRTLLHEFGHALQHLLTDLTSPMVSSIESAPMDFVELSSSVLEDFLNYEWAYENLTGSRMVMRDCCQYHWAFQEFRLTKQTHLGHLDLLMHGSHLVTIEELKTLEPQVLRFHHAIVSRYAGAYYGYALGRGLSRELHRSLAENSSFGPAFRDAVFGLAGRLQPLESLSPLLQGKSACGF